MFKLTFGPWRCEVARGEPIQAGGWRLTPIVGLLAFTRRRATIGARATTAAGAQWASIRPLAVEVAGNGRRRVMLLPDVTHLLVGALCLCALASSLAALGSLCRIRRRP